MNNCVSVFKLGMKKASCYLLNLLKHFPTDNEWE